MAHDAAQTRRRLVAAATEAFAEHGVHSASLLDIARQAGQRNRGAVHYHYGSRMGLLVAVLDQHADVLAERERELIDAARARPGDLRAAVEAFVLPAVEVADLGPDGRRYLTILAELVEEDPAAIDPDVVRALARLGGYEAYALLEERVPPMPDDVRQERLALVTAFVLRVVADRGRAADRAGRGRARLARDRFAANLVEMVEGMLTAPTHRDE